MNDTILFEHTLPTGQLIRVVQGDLTAETTGAIVNAANEWLSHGGGVAGAIVRRGGQRIQAESNAWVRQHGPAHTGSAAITGAGQLAAQYVFIRWGRCGAAGMMRLSWRAPFPARLPWPKRIKSAVSLFRAFHRVFLVAPKIFRPGDY